MKLRWRMSDYFSPQRRFIVHIVHLLGVTYRLALYNRDFSIIPALHCYSNGVSMTYFCQLA
jgi:hypothetical protein